MGHALVPTAPQGNHGNPDQRWPSTVAPPEPRHPPPPGPEPSLNTQSNMQRVELCGGDGCCSVPTPPISSHIDLGTSNAGGTEGALGLLRWMSVGPHPCWFLRRQTGGQQSTDRAAHFRPNPTRVESTVTQPDRCSLFVSEPEPSPRSCLSSIAR